MPFTFAHPAAVLPLRRRPFVTTALIVGSMSPDFEYFLRGRPLGTFSHSITGLIVFCVPAGLLLFLFIEKICKLPVVILLPAYARRRLSEQTSPASFVWWAVTGSVLVGAATHLAWDSFTHPSGTLVHLLPSLSLTIDSIAAFKWLQYFSNVVGLSVLGIFLSVRLRTARPDGDVSFQMSSATRWTLWACLLLLSGFAFLRPFLNGSLMPRTLGVAVVQSIDVAALFIAVYSLAVWAMMQRRRLPT